VAPLLQRGSGIRFLRPRAPEGGEQIIEAGGYTGFLGRRDFAISDRIAELESDDTSEAETLRADLTQTQEELAAAQEREKAFDRRSTDDLEEIKDAIKRAVKAAKRISLADIAAELGEDVAKLRYPLKQMIADGTIGTEGARRWMVYVPVKADKADKAGKKSKDKAGKKSKDKAGKKSKAKSKKVEEEADDDTSEE
jgi:Skp family chaperone for outer membrane proteins